MEIEKINRNDECPCPKGPNCYGAKGWHWLVTNNKYPQTDCAYEKCDVYVYEEKKGAAPF